LDVLEDPRFWNQMLVAESYSPALPRPERPVQQVATPKPRRRKRDPQATRQLLAIAGGLIAALFATALVIVLIYSGKDLIGSGGFGGWEEFRSEAGGFQVLMPTGFGAKRKRESRPMYGLTITMEGMDYGRHSAAAVGYTDLPATATPDWERFRRTMTSDARILAHRDVQLGSYRGLDVQARARDEHICMRWYFVDRRIYTLFLTSSSATSLESSTVNKFFDSFRLLGREDLKPTIVGQLVADEPKTETSSTSDRGLFGWFSGEEAKSKPSTSTAAADYAAARKTFRTSLRVRGPAPQDWEPLRTPRGAQRISYRSGGLMLAAFVDPAPANGGRRPGLLFLHGGFAFGDGDWEMADPYREAGFLVMMPVLRGENGQTGNFTLYFDEVDDVLAAADALAQLPYVDSNQICIAGHSAGGSLTALAAMASDRFRAAASLSGCMDQRMNEEIAPFDTSNDEEYRIRSPLDFATSFRCPTRLYYGSQEDWAVQSTTQTASRAKAAGNDVEAVQVPGDHFSSVPSAAAESIVFFRRHCRFAPDEPASPEPAGAFSAPSVSSPPSPGGPAASGGSGIRGPAVVFQVRGYEGRMTIESAAREALRRIPWADLSRLEYAESTGTLTVGLRGGSVDTASAKAALQRAGFQIGWTSILPSSQSR